MHARILKYLGRDLAKYPNFDFGGVITTFAVKEGGSEKIHIDWFDNMNMFAWVTAVGDFVGANFCSRSSVDRWLASPVRFLVAGPDSWLIAALRLRGADLCLHSL